jgi:hypothetical protein
MQYRRAGKHGYTLQVKCTSYGNRYRYDDPYYEEDSISEHEEDGSLFHGNG